MGNFTKEKNLFIITLDNEKTTSFNFATGTYIGVSGKTVKQFSAEARKVISKAINEDLLAYFFYKRTRKDSWWDSCGANKWSYQMVETIYSIYKDKLSLYELKNICEFCQRTDYTLDKKGVKILTEAIELIKDTENWWSWKTLELKIKKIEYENRLPQWLLDIICHNNLRNEETLIEDRDKIAFREEHEFWTKITESWRLGVILDNYITLTKKLGKERNYKNLFLSYALLIREDELLKEKLTADYQLNANLFFEDENFTVVIPTTAEEFQHEADYQQNCVFRLYYPKVLEQTTHIVFIRRKDDVNTPYITCEISNNGEIVQYLTRFNKYVTDADAIFFKDVYGEYLKRVFA